MGRRTRKRAVQQDGEEIARQVSISKRMKTEISVRVQIPQVRKKEDWAVNDLVLDNIFKKLEPKALKVVRQVCKKWCFNATRILSREATMTIGDRKSEVETQGASLTSHPAPSKTYTKIKEFLADSRATVFETGFRPTTINLLGCANVWRLPKWTFDKLKSLKINHFVTEEANRLLWSITQDFPDLLSLSLVDSYPVLCKSTKRRLAPKVKKTASLEHIELSLPLIWSPFTWEFMDKLPHLKSLKLKQESFGELGDTSNRAHFTECISKFPAERFGSKIDTLALDFNIHVNVHSTIVVIDLLSRLQLRRLDLYVSGSASELMKLVQEVKLPSESMSIKLLTVQGFNRTEFASIFTEFQNRGYLKLPEWSFSICEPGSGYRASLGTSLYAEFKMTPESLVFQNYAMAMAGSARSIDQWIGEEFPKFFPGYTYACVVSPGNQNIQYEIIDDKGSLTFKTDIIPRERVLLYNGCSSLKCEKLPKHLISYSGFREALKLKQDWVHNSGSWGVNYQYYKVPRKILETYKYKLVRRHYSIRQADYCCKPKMLSNLYIGTSSGIKALRDLALEIYLSPRLQLSKVNLGTKK